MDGGTRVRSEKGDAKLSLSLLLPAMANTTTISQPRYAHKIASLSQSYGGSCVRRPWLGEEVSADGMIVVIDRSHVRSLSARCAQASCTSRSQPQEERG